jgi:hypothetical protein
MVKNGIAKVRNAGAVAIFVPLSRAGLNIAAPRWRKAIAYIR